MSRCGEALCSSSLVRADSSAGSEQVIMATNRIESLDPALSECALEASRFPSLVGHAAPTLGIV